MKNKKKIHDLLSPKIAAKRLAKRNAARDIEKDENGEIIGPPSVDNFKANKPLYGPHKIKVNPAPVIPRKISKTEGAATVNTKTETKRFIHKPIPKVKEVDPAIGAIEVAPKKKTRRGRKRKTDVDKKTTSETP